MRIAKATLMYCRIETRMIKVFVEPIEWCCQWFKKLDFIHPISNTCNQLPAKKSKKPEKQKEKPKTEFL